MSSLHDELATLSPERRELLARLLARQGLEATALPIPRRRLSQAPLSFTQQRLWQIGRMAEATPLGNVPLAFHVRGPLDVPALGRTLHYLAARHEILRTRFDLVDEHARQLVQPNVSTLLRVTDLRKLPVADRREHAEALMRREAARPFKLTRAPLFRAELWQLGADETILLLLLHHLVVDGFAMRVLLRELSEAYAAICGGAEPTLPEPPIQYGDFAAWQRESLQGENLDRLVSFWERELAGCARAGLPSRRATSSPSFMGGSRHFSFSREFSEQLRGASRREGVTLFMLVAAALHVLERAYTCNDDVQICTTISSRNRRETEELIGNLGSSVVLRADLSGDPTLREVLERERRVVTAAQGHQELSLELLVEELRRRGSTTRVPPITTMLIARDSAAEAHVVLPHVTVTRLAVDLDVAWVELLVDVVDAPEIHGTLEYRSDAFDAGTIESFLLALRSVLETFVGECATKLSMLPQFQGPRTSTAQTERVYVAPTTPTEHRLQQMWEDVLDRRPVGVRDNFFEIGGHSLLVATLFTRITKVFGEGLSVSELLTAPTIEQLARVIDAAPPSSSSHIVRLAGAGTNTPVVAVHAGGGYVFFYRQLAKRIGVERPFYAIQAAAHFDGRLRPYDSTPSIERLASSYVEELRAVQPRGPYMLLGASFGATVAFEMARTLRQSGEEVGPVFLISPSVSSELPDSETTRGRLVRHTHALVHLSQGAALAYLARRVAATAKWQFILRRAQLDSLLRAALDTVERAICLVLRRPISSELINRRFMRASIRLLGKYRPEPYDGPVVLFRNSIDPDPAPEWRELARGGVEVHDLPGGHLDMLEEPLVVNLAALVNCHVAADLRDDSVADGLAS